MRKALFILAVLVIAFGDAGFAQQRKASIKSKATENVLKHYGVRDEVTMVPETAVWRTTEGDQYRTSYTYDEYDFYLIEELTESKVDGEWLDWYLMNYEYDFYGNVLEILALSSYGGEAWDYDAKASYTYDDDMLSEVVYQYWEDDDWVNETKEVYNYSDDVTTVLYWDWNGNNWSSDELWTYTYGNESIVLVIQYMQGGAWQNDEKVTFSLDFNGNIKEILCEDWENNTWVNAQQTMYFYEDDVYIEILVGFWMFDAWQVEYKYEFDYVDGNATHGSCNFFISGQMVSADGDIEMAYGYNAATKSFYGAEVDMTYIDLTGVNEDVQTTNFKVYPVPAENEIQIQSESFQKAEIYSVTGQKLMESLQDRMNVSELSSGIYLIKVYDREGGCATQRFVVK